MHFFFGPECLSLTENHLSAEVRDSSSACKKSAGALHHVSLPFIVTRYLSTKGEAMTHLDDVDRGRVAGPTGRNRKVDIDALDCWNSRQGSLHRLFASSV